MFRVFPFLSPFSGSYKCKMRSLGQHFLSHFARNVKCVLVALQKNKKMKNCYSRPLHSAVPSKRCTNNVFVFSLVFGTNLADSHTSCQSETKVKNLVPVGKLGLLQRVQVSL